MDNFEKASQHLMKTINEGKESILNYRGKTNNQENKYEELFIRLDNMDLDPENIKKQRLQKLMALVKELKSVVYNEKYNDKIRIMQLIMLIDINKNNLKYILDNKEEIVEYEQALTNIKKILEGKITSKTTSYAKTK